MAAKYDKKKLIKLQSIIFNSKEKKLMVSPEFLKEMTRHYISKRIKVINKNMEGIAATKVPQNFFSYLEIINNSLDELIVIEEFHKFSDPAPSAVKKTITAKKGRYIIAMLNRAWKDANKKANYDPRSDLPRKVEDFAPILEDFLFYRDNFTPDSMDVLNKFYFSVYGYNIGEEAPAAEETSAESDEFSDEFMDGDFDENDMPKMEA